jgi:hypothetical protein
MTERLTTGMAAVGLFLLIDTLGVLHWIRTAMGVSAY